MRASRLRTSFAATAAQYFVNGGVTAAIAASLPILAERFELSLGDLGLILTAQTVVLVAAMQVARWFVHRFGEVAVACIGTVAFSASPLLVAETTSGLTLVAALAYAGITNGVQDAGVPTLASRLERVRRRSRLSLMELCFVVGGAVGGIGAGLSVGRLDVMAFLRIAATVALVVAVVSSVAVLVSALRLPAEDATARAGVRRSLTLTLLGVIAFSSLWIEGALIDWSTFLYRERGAEGGTYVAGYIAFTVGLGIALAAGPWLIGRLGPVMLARCGGIIVMVAVAAALLSPSLVLTTAALFVAGVGLANIHPLAMSAAGGIAPAVRSIAMVNTLSYLGMTGSKPYIGAVADATSLTFALGLIVVLGFLMAVLAKALAGAEAGN